MRVPGRVAVFALAALTPAWIGVGRAQDSGWEAAAGGKAAFEVASIKLDKGEFHSPSFPLDAGDAFVQTGGAFSADFPVVVYIQFAYKFRWTPPQRDAALARLPKWVATDRFDIQARATGPTTKDKMRLMVRALLEDRFHLSAHWETQQTPVLALSMVKPGTFGPKLRLHSSGPPCDAAPGPNVFPVRCDVEEYLRFTPKRTSLVGSRNATMEGLASSLVGLGDLDRPVVDRTGVTERVDYSLEWSPEGGAEPSDDAPAFHTALHDQLGLKLQPTTAPLRVLVVDHIEPPTEN